MNLNKVSDKEKLEICKKYYLGKKMQFFLK